MIGFDINPSNDPAQSYARVLWMFVMFPHISRHDYPDKLLRSFVGKWDVLNNKTAVPIDVTQNPNTEHSC